MTERRRGLGRGLGALIPTTRPGDAYDERPPAHEDREPAASAPPSPTGDQREATGGDTAAASAAPVASPAQVWQSADHASRQGAGDHDGAEPAAQTVADPSAPEVPETPGTETADLVETGARFAEIPPARIRMNPRQPRQVFDEDALEELVSSIREVGVLQPIVVRELTGDDEHDFELVMGERRWRAATAAGLERIPAIVRETSDDAMLRDALLENLHRSQLNPLEEAAAYDQLLRDFGCTQDELAERIGRSRPQISNTIRLLRLPPSVQRRLAAGVLTAGHARALLGLEDPAAQERLAQRIVAEGLSVRSVEELVAVGDGLEPRRTLTRGRRPVAPALGDLAARLSDRFETRVKVDLGRRKGRITVEFASIADLERIVAVMDPAVVGDLTAELDGLGGGTDLESATDASFGQPDGEQPRADAGHTEGADGADVADPTARSADMEESRAAS